MAETSVWIVAAAAMVTAIFTGFGALPFLFVKNISTRVLGYGNAAAAGLMLGASIGLVIEGLAYGAPRLVLGLVLGLVLIIVAQRALSGREVSVGELEGADAKKMLLIVGIMTVHSFAEGIGVGVSYGGGEAFGALISIAIAIHNIPEGLAISLVLVPRGTSVWRAAWWSVFSSLPQPLMAIPAYLFVRIFEPFLPVGLGIAAGAMFWMVFRELMPEAREEIPQPNVLFTMTACVIGMLAFQAIVGG